MPVAFTPIASLFGGALIGLSASALLALNGRIAGISGILGGLVNGDALDRGWRAAFLGGLLGGGVLVTLLFPAALQSSASSLPVGITVAAGLLVGLGTQLGGGCTSGHGVCGISRLSKRSLVATMTFMVVGALATFLVQHVVLRGAT
jgi:uncharacterized membrane protein YedE/YeeE